MDKPRWRAQALERRRMLATAKRVLLSADILGRLFALPEMAAAHWVHFYVSTGSEVETRGMIAHALMQKKRVTVPRVDVAGGRLELFEIESTVRDLVPGFHGILEPRGDGRAPVAATQMELLVVPGVAYDAAGNRIGRGGGYYDRLLMELRDRVPIVAPAFECQIVERLPAEDHDQPVEIIVTEKRVIRLPGA